MTSSLNNNIALPVKEELRNEPTFYASWLYFVFLKSLNPAFSKNGKYFISWKHFAEFCRRYAITKETSKDVGILWILEGRVGKHGFSGFDITNIAANVRGDDNSDLS